MSEGFRGVPGVPDGWELVWFGKPKPGDFVLNWVGQVERWNQRNTAYVFPVIRKIEQPAKYRPFANADEFRPNVGRYVEVVKETSECEMDRGDTLLIVGVSYDSVLLYGGWITFKAAFECLVFGDGTPFGVRVDD